MCYTLKETLKISSFLKIELNYGRAQKFRENFRFLMSRKGTCGLPFNKAFFFFFKQTLKGGIKTMNIFWLIKKMTKHT